MIQELTLDHARPEAEVVEHVFRIHAKHPAEIHAASEHNLTGVPDKGGNLIAADAFPAPDGKVITTEI
jgi:hypothetical protein